MYFVRPRASRLGIAIVYTECADQLGAFETHHILNTTPPHGLNVSSSQHTIWSAVNLEELLQCLLHIFEDDQMPALRISLADQ